MISSAPGNAGGVDVYDILVDGERTFPNPENIRSTEIKMSVNEHERADISYRGPLAKSREMVGRTISFGYGERGEFYGYVYRVNPESETGSDPQTTIQCVGTTKVLLTSHQRMWEQTTAFGVLTEIVTQGKLGVAGDDDGFVWPVISQTTQSDWAVLTELSNRTGYMLVATGGVVGLYDPLRVLTDSIPAARLVMGTPLDTARKLLAFGETTSENLSFDESAPVYGVFGGVTDGKSIKDSPNDFDTPSHLDSRVYVGSLDEAKKRREAWKLSSSNWTRTGVARIHGDAHIVPGDTVYVQKSEAPNMGDPSDGVWLVTSVSHVLDRKKFQTQLALVRDDVRRFFPITLEGKGKRAGRQTHRLWMRENEEGHLRWVSPWAFRQPSTAGVLS